MVGESIGNMNDDRLMKLNIEITIIDENLAPGPLG
jgi:hypothetical protein